MNPLADKLKAAAETIDTVLANYRHPAVMWSSGKDSMVLLHLLRARQVNCPVIFHREPFFPIKYEFADRIIREWGLVVYDWPPAAVTLQKMGGVLDLVSHYQIGPNAHCQLPQSVYEPPAGEPMLCGLKDFIHRPVGSFRYPWDVVFHGHKSSDVDPALGPVPLHVDIKQNIGGPAAAFPLRHWTDADIWSYTEQADVPQQWDRYAEKTGRENPDRTTNPDYFACCTRCLDRDNPASVFCPKLGKEVSNLSAQIAHTELKLDYFGKA